MAVWSNSEAEWAALWARYDAKSDLAELDAWYLTSFPSILRTHEPEPHLTQPELTRLMEWKLKKGKWRPQLMKFVSGLSESEVKDASLNAFKQLKGGDLRAATEAMCVLKGVGPATASAVLAAYDESVPFMADEALEAIAGAFRLGSLRQWMNKLLTADALLFVDIIGPRKYTLAHFLSFAEQLRAKATWLNDQRAANDDKKAGDSELWTAQRVQLCLYAAAHDGAAPASSNKKTASPAAKRKRGKQATPSPAKTEEKVQQTLDEGLRRSQRKRQRPTA
ncbi:hypothetical protein PHMEG_00025477 [Phytophthora megakarya]|uniref:Uncharacterized protein n=1 Tax=Phytophthora megakarya TaxID=4795 RepID=A0A225VD66_9STRA|nr:hypothetical protein PHMEG_00025477 [Phytophthora megakarya]